VTHAIPLPTERTHDTTALREELFQHLRDQGFKLTTSGLIVPVNEDKNSLRQLHQESVDAQRERARGALGHFDETFTRRLASGDEIDPSRIDPKLLILSPGRHPDAFLWRWCSLHWAIPVSSGYGRRLRALVIDAGHNNSVMGLIGLSDPVFALRVRDTEIGWSPETRKTRLANVMDAFVLGAVPPYADLLAGKLVASMLQSTQVRDAFRERYGHKTTLISGRDPDAELALVTTTSALGRSSVYNRVHRADKTLAMRSIGFTSGSGDFHLSGAIYEKLAALAASGTAEGVSQRHENWGTGFRNRREVIQRAMRLLSLDPNRMRVHGVRREVFLSEMANNSIEWLKNQESELDWRTLDQDDISSWWLQRWATPRAASATEWRNFDRSTWALYRDN
jgi:hypothetical protein